MHQELDIEVKKTTLKSITILLIEDNEGDVRLIREMLKEVSNTSFKVEVSRTLSKALNILKQHTFNIILLDLNLPDSMGFETAKKTIKVALNAPIIILTGLNEEKLAISTMKRGIQDYLVKEQLNSTLLGRSIQYAIERKQLETNLKESEQKYKTLSNELELILDNIPALIFYKDTKNNYIRANQYIADAHNMKKEELIGRSLFEFYPKDQAQAYWDDDLEVIKSGKPKLNIEEPWETKDGLRWVLTGKIPLIDINGHVIGIIGTSIDITERKKLEEGLKRSEKKYRYFFNNAQVGLYWSGISDGKILECNNTFAKLFGYNTREECLANYNTIEHYIDPNARSEMLEEIRFNNEVKNYEIHITKKDGTPIWLNISARMFERENRIEGAAIDITARKKAEQDLKESEVKYRYLLETAAMGLIEVDLIVNKISYINPKLLKIIGYKREELLQDNKIFYNLIHPEDIEDLLNSYDEKELEFRIFTKNRKLKWLLGIKFYNYNDKGEPVSLRVWLQDITESKELEQIKASLLTRFSHEFKTPLISINGFTDFLLTEYKKKLDEKTISFLKRIKEGSVRLKSLINSFLKSSQLDNARVKINLKQKNLSELIKEGLEELEGLIHMREHSISLDIDEKLITNLDKEKIYTVITNLLLNAIKYTPKGGNILVQSSINDDSIIISVKDDGIGLNEEDKSHLFKPFGKIERYGKGWDIVSEGMGMGLYISKEIIDLHGGKIWAESEGLNKGTTFYFSLPSIRY